MKDSENIIKDCAFRPAVVAEAEAPVASPSTPPAKIIPLTVEEFNAMGSALARLHEIKNTKPEGSILTRDRKNNSEALAKEGSEIVSYLAELFITHGAEFLGCFQVAHGEYEPLVNGLIPLFRRLAATAAQQSKAAK